ncbi:C4-dicarboxylate ABC transporter [Rhodococcus sp. IEGM 1408]|uniref:SLAC1 family transporter n=1 Tax=Rhodococcus sp. IEGM 1408 TaxID=3082220 RepID=UPI0029544F1C|nr:C4-dicarboxylate ABC transporter [Rhodococcus sp. IEGM 1408]MDV8000962.1 C4-dicarboxylate ABC transporter [Rhodococcus sp. IEGM 1408]
MSTAPAAGPGPRVPAVPGPGPAWFGAVMGTGGLCALLQIHSVRLPVFGPLAVITLLLGWVLLIGLGAGFARSVARDPDVWTRSVRDAAMLPLWGMVSMGLLATGSATYLVVDAHAPSLSPVAFGIDAALWGAGTVLGLATAIGFAAWLFTTRPAHPLPTWALPMVPPMVSATSGGLLAEQIDSATARAFVVAVCTFGFVAALGLGGAVITMAYHHAWFRTPVPVALSTSTWIPLGIVGQSAAAAQVLAAPGQAGIARLYGAVVLIAGAGLGAFAVLSTFRGFLARMAFNPGWWAMAYPLGTCALGAHYLGWETASLVTVFALCGVWLLCAVASTRAIMWARLA